LEAAHKRWLKEWGELARKIENETATDEELHLYQRAKNACYYRKGPEASAAADRSFPEVELRPEVRMENNPPIAGNVADSTEGVLLGGAPVTNAIVDRGRVLLPGKAPLLYLVYDNADAAWAEKVKKNFFLSEKNGLVEIFDVSKIPPGAKREELLPQVHRFAKAIAYLTSIDLLSWLDFREMYRLSPNARHIPILLRPCAHCVIGTPFCGAHGPGDRGGSASVEEDFGSVRRVLSKTVNCSRRPAEAISASGGGDSADEINPISMTRARKYPSSVTAYASDPC
jgi:hypothetical protein